MQRVLDGLLALRPESEELNTAFGRRREGETDFERRPPPQAAQRFAAEILQLARENSVLLLVDDIDLLPAQGQLFLERLLHEAWQLAEDVDSAQATRLTVVVTRDASAPTRSRLIWK